MSKQLLNNLTKMRNDEIVGLAKNRFLPKDLQLAIVDLPYRTGHKHLIENAGLCAEARDMLWSDRVNSGYVYKTELITNGHYKDEPEKYWELFDKHPSAWYRSEWRMLHAFVYSKWSWWGKALGLECGANYTPTDLLNTIYDQRYKKSRFQPEPYSFGSHYRHKAFVEHPNCDLKLAIKVSTCGFAEAEKRAFEKIVELS